jgi:group I intron endonuclease
MIKGYIYYLADPDFPNTPKYIGKTIQTLRRRLRGHICNKKNIHTLCSIWIKSLIRNNKEPIIVSIEESIENFDYLNLLEQYWISQFKTWGFVLKNHTLGGEGSFGYTHTQETKDKISLKKIGKPGTTLGRKRPPEECERLSKLHKGKKLSKEHVERLRQVNKGNKYSLGVYPSEETRKKLSEKSKGRIPKLKGLNNTENWKPVLQFTKEGVFIKEWESRGEAEKVLGIKGISNCCVRPDIYKTAGGFKWKYKYKNLQDKKEKMEFHISKIE